MIDVVPAFSTSLCFYQDVVMCDCRSFHKSIQPETLAMLGGKRQLHWEKLEGLREGKGRKRKSVSFVCLSLVVVPLHSVFRFRELHCIAFVCCNRRFEGFLRHSHSLARTVNYSSTRFEARARASAFGFVERDRSSLVLFPTIATTHFGSRSNR
jgi:hypothetical protein